MRTVRLTATWNDDMIREVVKLCGLSKPQIMQKLQLLDGCGVSFEVQEKYLDAEVVMTTSIDSAMFDVVRSTVYNIFENEVYSSESCSLQELAASLLKMSGHILGVAESLTCGLVCAMLAEVSGISENLYEGIVCYNKGSKMNRLGVSKETLSARGAISRETAYEMVRGLTVAPVDIGLSTTGLAGPSGDEGKPVGLTYIGVGSGDFILTFEKRFEGTRDEIRHAAANVALFYLIRYLKGDIWRL
ncbi:MAG: CinA family protein [Clostridia bacterium]|nr:CinA family protein [Clostridia bacterium]